MPEKVFNRGLSTLFVQELQTGHLAPLFHHLKSASLDIQIRACYIDAYAQGRGVLSIKEKDKGTRFKAKIHEKFLDGVTLPNEKLNGDYFNFLVTPTFINDYIFQFPVINANSQKYVKPEGIVEDKIIQICVKSGESVIFFDRQVKIPGENIKADAIGWQNSNNGNGKIIIAEIKQGLDNRIQDLITQMESYASIIGKDGILRNDMEESYRKVIVQKQQLGLLPDNLTLPSEKLEIECVFILYDYNMKSKLLDRLRSAAKLSSLRTKLILLPKDVFELPHENNWESL
ncbi:MAG: hypothetical protein WCO98_15480 [bacterium]